MLEGGGGGGCVVVVVVMVVVMLGHKSIMATECVMMLFFSTFSMAERPGGGCEVMMGCCEFNEVGGDEGWASNGL